MDDEQMLLCCICKNVLQIPMQLSCLHNCCARCLGNTIKADDSRCTTCAICMEVTDVRPKKVNTFIACRIKNSAATYCINECGICAEEGRHEVRAELWCGKCQKSLCADCLRGHGRYRNQHVMTPLKKVQSQNSMESVKARRCQLHEKVFDFVCLSCAVPQCEDCGLMCAQANHSVQLLGSKQIDDLTKKLQEDINKLQEAVDSKADILRLRKSLTSNLKTARVLHIQELEKKKRAILDAIEVAFGSAKAAIHDNYDILDVKASEIASTADQLGKKVCHALSYSRIVVDAGGIADLLQQQHALLSRLQYLATEVEQLQAPLDAGEYVTVNCTEPERLDELMKEWIGTPVLLTDDLFCSIERVRTLEAAQGRAAQKNDREQPNEDDKQPDSKGIPFKVMDLNPNPGTLKLPVHCVDLAVTSDGCRLLLALRERGLRERYLNGLEVRSWIPARQTPVESVVAVGVADCDRVVASLQVSRRVVLLTRSDDSWRVISQVTVEIEPGRMSVYGMLVVVSECPWPGQCLVLAHIGDSIILRRQQREYRIARVAVTREMLVTASSETVRLVDGRALYVVDACNHQGQLLWRQDLGSVWGICVVLSGQALYIGSGHRDVIAVRAKDGAKIKDVLTDGGTKNVFDKNGYRALSMNGEEERTIVAMLHSDNLTLTLYLAKPLV